ncbi:hypothetical protein RND81_01G205000 [Saponaria officinalis]|uniref:Acid phosphatase/vanadium-dependent haloperoxidase-related protein n=1 Tax=Saponaria officinalis TaxID=3572 RepID=A0AAW1NH98_SAPOF
MNFTKIKPYLTSHTYSSPKLFNHTKITQKTQKKPHLCSSHTKFPHNHSKISWVFSYTKNPSINTIVYNQKNQITPLVATLSGNSTFVSGLFALVLAQCTKMLLSFFVEKKLNLRTLCSSGGMPSSHSALCTALTTSVGICHGVSDSLFSVCLGFSVIVMYDAIGVRRHAGMQAQVNPFCWFLVFLS